MDTSRCPRWKESTVPNSRRDFLRLTDGAFWTGTRNDTVQSDGQLPYGRDDFGGFGLLAQLRVALPGHTADAADEPAGRLGARQHPRLVRRLPHRHQRADELLAVGSETWRDGKVSAFTVRSVGGFSTEVRAGTFRRQITLKPGESATVRVP
jgi:hypothetical protein